MGKDPAFLFYSSDFLTGTMFMTHQQVGKYIRLLCAQHQIGHLTEEDMINICGAYDERIYSKFEKDAEGKYYNVRCEDEINKRKKYSESRRNNRKSKKDMINISKTYDEHMENENENVIIDKELNEIPLLKGIKNDLFKAMFLQCTKSGGKLSNIAAYKKEYATLLGNNTQIIDRVKRVTGWNDQMLRDNVKQFILDQEAVHKEYCSPAEYFGHFLNWSKKQK